ncbi:hypothetical protein L1987_15188 [Smallanthus sonchifolius]|uniref:Uncharacterized protein n=1 Tax=Smallanthus sonchifolius TaxID=185202 RepID=A0ACB9J8E0_9ASTR|nr:hypothetical protein L1987_15188 [Smallanthus sonchifolius]
MAAPTNGFSSSSRRRHRSSSLRDSPDEDGGVEVQEPGRLRDRGVVKKDRGDRDRDRERSSRSKRRRENKMMIHHVNTGSNRDDGDDTSEESVNDEDEEDDDDAGNGGGLRMLPPPPANTSTAAAALTNNHHNHSSHPQHLHHRKSFPPSANKVFRAAAPAAAPLPAWKVADEMIGVSVPRKARSASTKRSHEWISGVSVAGGVGGTYQINRQSSTSPVRLAASPAPVAPPSPSSSNVSVRKKMKANGGGSKPRPPKSSSKSSSSNPEELEIEIAEVLYGLMTQSQAPSKKEIPSNDSAMKSSSETKFRVSSPTALPQNSTSLSTVAPKRKRPRQVSENPFNVRSSLVSSSIKTEIDHQHQHQHHQSPKTDISSPYLENNSPASVAAATAAENGVSSFGFTTLPGHKASSSPSSEPPVALLQQPAAEDMKCGVGEVLTKEEAKKESASVESTDGNGNTDAAIKTGTNLKLANPESQNQKDEKFEIDLMAPPPQQRSFQGSDGEVDFSDHKQMETSKTKEDEKLRKSGKEESMKLTESGTIQETGESSKQAFNEEMNIELSIDLEKSNKGIASSIRSLHQALKHQQLSAKSDTHTEKTAQSSSMPMSMSVANWPPMGYVAPLQGVISMDGNTMASAPIQPLFTHPRPKRCATHCYIARNIHYLQQFMKISPFWPATSGSAAPMFGAKPCNLNVMPSTDLHANIPQAMQDKGQAVGIFPGHTTGKDTKSSQATTVTDPTQRKQQVLLHQAMPPVAPNNILHGPAFIFPFNQQQAVAASASVRPGSSKLTASTAGGASGAASGAANSPTVSSSTTAAAPALSFNYPNMSANETQYLAILQNNPYSFPMPAVGAPPNYRSSPHAQAMPLFNGSFYSSQMIHPSQIPQPPQQAPPPTQAQNHHPSQSQQTHQNSSGSTSSSQKHLQAQQRQQGSGAAVNGGGSGSGGSLHNSYHAAHKSRSQQPSQQQNQHMNPALQARHLENEVTGGEDSSLTADNRVSRAANTMSVYSHNFAMPVHPQNFALMNPQAALSNAAAAASANSNDKKQQQQGLKRGGVESSIPPQTFAMSFAPMNGTTGTISSMAQNHAIFQSVPDSLRQSYHQMMTSPAAAAASAHHSQQKDFRISEEATRTAGHDSSNADDDRKVSAGLAAKSGQSIAFSRPDLATDASGSPAANNRSSRSPISTSIAAAAAQSSHHLHAQFQQQQQQQQQQQVLQLQKQQQNARTKNPPSSNGSSYPEHLITSSSSMAAKFPNSISSFPLQTSNTGGSPAQSPQWRNSVRGPTTSQVPSSLASAATTTSSLKNLHQSQQHSIRSHQQSHSQISFSASASQKLQSTTSVQMQQQQQNQNPSSNSGNQSPSPPMLVGSPTTSISKGGGAGAGGSPRTSASASTSGRTGQASLSSSQQVKNTPVGTQRSSPSILGNPHNSNSKSQQQQLPPQQLQKQTLQQQQAQAQAHMFFTHPYMQVQQPQAQQHSASSPAATGYYLPRKQQQQSSSSTAMLSLSQPVTLANTTTSDPAKAIAAATSNLKGGVGLTSQQGILHAAQYGAAAAAQSSMPAGFPQYVHNAPAAAVEAAAVQVKPAEQKQPAGNDDLRTWQPEKK